MAEHHIQCEACGGPYTAARSDAKQCANCRLLRILTWTASRCGHRACRACGEKYAPARRQDRLCGTCDTAAQPDRLPKVTCSICKRDAPKFERVAVCASCAKSPTAQPIVIRALQKGQAARRDASAA